MIARRVTSGSDSRTLLARWRRATFLPNHSLSRHIGARFQRAVVLLLIQRFCLWLLPSDRRSADQKLTSVTPVMELVFRKSCEADLLTEL